MNRFSLKPFALIGLLLAACQAVPAPPPARTPEATIAQQTPTPTSLVATTAEPLAAIGNVEVMLRGWLILPRQKWIFVTARPQEWPDACLGLPVQGEMCAQAVTPGYKITFDVNGGEYVFHTDPQAYRFRVAAAPLPAIGDKLVTWTGMKTPEEGSCATADIGTQALTFS